jgi:hypothetical protein
MPEAPGQQFRIQPQTNTENTDFLVEYLTFVRVRLCLSVVIFEFGIAEQPSVILHLSAYNCRKSRRVRKAQGIGGVRQTRRVCAATALCAGAGAERSPGKPGFRRLRRKCAHITWKNFCKCKTTEQPCYRYRFRQWAPLFLFVPKGFNTQEPAFRRGSFRAVIKY